MIIEAVTNYFHRTPDRTAHVVVYREVMSFAAKHNIQVTHKLLEFEYVSSGTCFANFFLFRHDGYRIGTIPKVLKDFCKLHDLELVRVFERNKPVAIPGIWVGDNLN